VTFSNGQLDGKVALVTGGSRGIGAAIARRLASDGAAVSITYSNSSDDADRVIEDIERLGGRGVAIRADCADTEAVKAAIGSTSKRFGGLDILVNNAALFRLGLIEDFPLEDIDRMLAINVRSLLVAIQESLRFMGKGGRIINIGSISSDYMPISGVPSHAQQDHFKRIVQPLQHLGDARIQRRPWRQCLLHRVAKAFSSTSNFTSPALMQQSPVQLRVASMQLKLRSSLS
jgi:NAD(P)-dependent dehydrogenase (short-subunit alcohol dehydrogenase family)